MKILYVTTIGGTMDFFEDYIELLISKGHKVDLACNNDESKVPSIYQKYGCKIYQIDTSRNLLKYGNFSAILQLKKIVEKNSYDIVHCHTPIAAACTRIACRKARKKGLRVFYTAHGFHFYKGAPIKNWLLFYPMEKICSYFTDVLVTINQEDYFFAKKKLKAGQIEYVPGIGIDLDKYKKINLNKTKKIEELEIPKNAKILLSVGELNKNKNHELVIRAILDIENICYVIAGEGELKEYLIKLVEKLSLQNRVKILGFRKDINELCSMSDYYIMPSFREGLPVSLMEAMACGLPCSVSRIRGNVDLIDENGGSLFSPYKIEECKNALLELLNKNYYQMSAYNQSKIITFGKNAVFKKMLEIYKS